MEKSKPLYVSASYIPHYGDCSKATIQYTKRIETRQCSIYEQMLQSRRGRMCGKGSAVDCSLIAIRGVIGYAQYVHQSPTSRQDGRVVVLLVILEVCMFIRVIYNRFKF